MLSAIPVIGWLLSFVFSVSLAVPFYFLWNSLSPIYFYWLPQVYLSLPFWHVVWLFMLLSILKAVLLPSFRSSSTCEK